MKNLYVKIKNEKRWDKFVEWAHKNKLIWGGTKVIVGSLEDHMDWDFASFDLYAHPYIVAIDNEDRCWSVPMRSLEESENWLTSPKRLNKYEKIKFKDLMTMDGTQLNSFLNEED